MKSLVKEISQNPNYKKLNNSIIVSICLACLGLAQVLKGSIVAAFPHLLPIFFCVGFFGSSIQGSISDIYRRSVILNIALCVIFSATFILILSSKNQSYLVNFLQIICFVLIGLAGNADVVGRAGMIDIHPHMDRRKLMSWSVFAEAFSWVIIGLLMRYLQLDPFNILTICLVFSVIILLFSFFFNLDTTTDKQHLRNTLNELNLIIKKNAKKLIYITLIVITGELGYFFFFYSQENNIPNKLLLADSYLSWFIGMSFGCWILTKFKHSNDFIFLILGIVISLFSVILFLAGGAKSFSVEPKIFYFDSLVYGIAGLGSGIYLPCFYSMISRGYSIHFQGILTGWIDSLRTLGDALSTVSLLGLALMSELAPLFISVLMFVLALFLLIAKKRTVF